MAEILLHGRGKHVKREKHGEVAERLLDNRVKHEGGRNTPSQ